MNGYGFPAWRGGPMFFADTIGLREVADRGPRVPREARRVVGARPALLELAAAERRFKPGRVKPWPMQ